MDNQKQMIEAMKAKLKDLENQVKPTNQYSGMVNKFWGSSAR
jgi:hypothetical protein